MICSLCHKPIPEALLDCPNCLERKAERASDQLHKAFAQEIVDNDAPIVLVYQPGVQTWHLQRVGDPHHSFCWTVFPPVGAKRDRAAYRDFANRANTCSACLERLAQFRREGAPAHV